MRAKPKAVYNGTEKEVSFVLSKTGTFFRGKLHRVKVKQFYSALINGHWSFLLVQHPVTTLKL